MKFSFVTSKEFLNNKIFDPVCRDKVTNRFIILREMLDQYGIDLATYDINALNQSALSLHLNIHPGVLAQERTAKRLLVISESPIVLSENHQEEHRSKFDRILTWETTKVDQIDTFRLGCGCSATLLFDDTMRLSQERRKDICIISGHKFSKKKYELYSERDRAICHFANSSLDFDMYGEGWNCRVFQGVWRPLNRFPLARTFLYQPPEVFKGSVASKFLTLSNYRFSICFENVHRTKGYVSEKIFDSMFSGCIPIYLGADDICDYVPSETFIDMRNYDSYDSLESFLCGMTPSTYKRYLDAIRDFYSEYTKSSFHEQTWAKRIAGHCLELIKNY